jgi:hypothetical protein
MQREPDNVPCARTIGLRELVHFSYKQFTLGAAMATTHEYSIDLVRNVAWTYCGNGPLDLRPYKGLDKANYFDACLDFEEQSFHPMPTQGESMHCWAPGYAERATHANHVVETIRADLLAVTMANISAEVVHSWLIEYNIAGLVWPTITSTLLRPTCCLTILLNRTVTAHTYKQLWLKLARDVFSERSDPAQADCRYRFDYPRILGDQSLLLRHDGHAFPVDYALTLDKITSHDIDDYATMHADYIRD